MSGPAFSGIKIRLILFGVLLVVLGLLVVHEYSERQSFKTRFPIRIDQQSVSVRVAARFAERARGLMLCKQLEPDEGMLFVFSVAEKLSFWMKDTPLPLDVGFFDSNGILFEVRSLAPFDETVIQSTQPGHYALEVSQGWFSRHQVKPGARLDLATVSAAISRR